MVAPFQFHRLENLESSLTCLHSLNLFFYQDCFFFFYISFSDFPAWTPVITHVWINIVSSYEVPLTPASPGYLCPAFRLVFASQGFHSVMFWPQIHLSSLLPLIWSLLLCWMLENCRNLVHPTYLILFSITLKPGIFVLSWEDQTGYSNRIRMSYIKCPA